MRDRKRVPRKVTELIGRAEASIGQTKDQSVLIISVQSQKGGVGKSTAALALAELLAEKKYGVLVVDADITGTNLATAVESSRWIDVAHIVESIGKENAAFDLASFFVHDYLAGGSLPGFSASAEPGSLSASFSSSRPVNVIGSSFPFSRKDSAISPDLLFNEVYSLTFIEYLKELAGDFHRESCSHMSETGQRTAIIIDNSPGHIGIVPAIENWLTNLGPVAGKFLFLSTPDYQDITAVGRTAQWLHTRGMEKWSVSRKYHEMKVSSPGKPAPPLDRSLLEGEAGQFFLSMAAADVDSAQGESRSVGKLPRSYRFFLASHEGKKHEYVETPSRCIGTVFNLVPESLLESIRRASGAEIQRLVGSAPGEGLSGKAKKNRRAVLGLSLPKAARLFVPFDPSLRDQYMNPAYSVLASRTRDRDFEALDYFLNRLSQQLQPLEYAHDGLHFRSMRALTVAIDLANQATDALALHGSPFGRSQIRLSWMPSSIMPLLRDLSLSLMPDLPIRITPWDREVLAEQSYRVNERAMNLSRTLANNLDSGMSEDSYIRDVVETVSETLSVAVEVAFSDPESIPFNDMRIFETAIEATRRILVLARIEAKDPNSRASNRTPSLARMLMRQARGERISSSDEVKNESSSQFEHGYSLLCMAAARVLDLYPDVQFLFRIVRALAELEPGRTGAAMRIASIADSRIVEKLSSNDEANHALASEQVSARQRTAFEGALGLVMTNWGILGDET